MSKNTGRMAAARAAKRAIADRVIAYVKAGGERKTGDVSQLLGLSVAQTKEFLRDMRENGQLSCVGRSTKAVWRIFPGDEPQKKKPDTRKKKPKPEPPGEFSHRIVAAEKTKPPRQCRFAVRSVFELGTAL